MRHSAATASSLPVVLVLVFLGIAVVLAALAPRLIRPYDEQAMLEQADRENGALCDKFGVARDTPRFADCKSDLTSLRGRPRSW